MSEEVGTRTFLYRFLVVVEEIVVAVVAPVAGVAVMAVALAPKRKFVQSQ